MEPMLTQRSKVLLQATPPPNAPRAVRDQGQSRPGTAFQYTCRTCPVRTFGRAGTNLGRATGRDHLTAAVSSCMQGSTASRLGTNRAWCDRPASGQQAGHDVIGPARDGGADVGIRAHNL